MSFSTAACAGTPVPAGPISSGARNRSGRRCATCQAKGPPWLCAMTMLGLARSGSATQLAIASSSVPRERATVPRMKSRQLAPSVGNRMPGRVSRRAREPGPAPTRERSHASCIGSWSGGRRICGTIAEEPRPRPAASVASVAQP